MELAEFQKSLQETEGKINARLAAIEDAQRRAAQAGVDGQKAEKPVSFGHAFVKSEAYSNFISGRATKASFTKAAASPVLEGTLPGAQRLGVIGSAVAMGVVGVRGAFGKINVSTNMVEFPQLKAWVNSADEIAEGAQKPESKAEFDIVRCPIETIPHFIRISKQLAEDATAVADFINDLMDTGLDSVVDSKLLSSTSMKGLFTAGNYIAHGLSQGAGDTNLDLIRKSASAIRTAGYAPDIVILNPTDYDAIMSVKTTDGAYIMVNPASDSMPKLWGLDVVLSSNMAQGSFLVGDSRQAKVLDRQLNTVEMFEQDGDNVQKNLITIRAETRLGLGVLSPVAFVGGALW